MFRYDVVTDLLATTSPIDATLQPSSVVLIGAMWDILSARYNWRASGDVADTLTAADYDAIEAMVAGLYADITTPIETPEVGTGMIIGSIFAAATTLTPTGCLVCDGSLVEAESYPLLAAVIDPQYLTVIEDIPMILLPNIKGRVVVGAGLSLPQGSEFGEYTHTLTVAELPSHNHLQRYHSNTSGSQTGHVADVTSQSPVNEMVATANTGGDTPFDISQPSIAFWYYIVAM